MEYFVNNVASKKYSGRKFEMQCSLMNIRTVYFYANSTASESFMPGDKLEQAFYKTLTLFPWLAGYLEPTTDGGFEIVVDKGNLNMPVYRESHSGMHFKDIQSSGFNRTTWPEDLVPVSELAYPDKATGIIKLVNVHIMRLKDNSGVIFSYNLNHGVSDGVSCVMFFNRWAEEMRALIDGVPAKEANFCFGPDILLKYLPDERAPLGETARAVYSVKSRMADFIMWLSPNARAKLLSNTVGKEPTCGHVFRITRAKLDELRSQALEHLQPGSRLSVNDILTAAISSVHKQAEAEVAMKSRGWLSKLTSSAKGIAGEHCLIFPCDLRGRLGMTELNYTGNPLISEFVVSPMSQAHLPITSKAVAAAASQVRSLMSDFTPEYIGQIIDMVRSDNVYISNYLAVCLNYKVVSTVSYLLGIGLYQADFGYGVSKFTTVHPEFNMRTFMIMPSPPPSTDILVNVCVSPPVMNSILKNKFWMNLAEVVY